MLKSLSAVLLFVILSNHSPVFSQTGPLSPEDSLATFVLQEGAQIELIAAEPLVDDPVAVAFDEKGRMFVAEDRDYPTGPKEGDGPGGRVSLLTDSDGDGVYDERTSFAEDLTYPNGLLPSKGGVYVTDAPDLLFFKDTDGDGIADLREVVLTGFALGGTTQLRSSHPTFGLDGWIYLTNGLSGGEVSSPKHPDRPPLTNRTNDWKFNPETGEVRLIGGQAQFGHTFDAFGRRFVCSNRKPIEQVMFDPDLLARNIKLRFTETSQTVTGGHDTPAPLFAISEAVTTADSHAGTFTAACGLTFYGGSALGERRRETPFMCDPTGNLVHQDVLTPAGSTFAATSATPGKEFLAGTDLWFRPVFLADGPGGALYLCDMYRKTIEHPQYLPKEIAAVTDFDSGKGYGRVFRIRGADPRPFVPFDPSDLESLVREFDSPDAWRRNTARRLLLENPRKKEAVKFLNSVLRESDLPEARVLALHTLNLIGGLIPEDVRFLLADKDARVRENAVKLSPRFFGTGDEFDALVLELAKDPAPRVRFETAIALGKLDKAGAPEALAKIAVQDAGDRWTRAAVLSSVADRENPFLAALLSALKQSPEGSAPLMEQVGELMASSLDRDRFGEFFRDALSIESPRHDDWRISTFLGFEKELRRHSNRSTHLPLLDGAIEATFSDPTILRAALETLANRALEDSGSVDLGIDKTERRIRFLGIAGTADATETESLLFGFLDPIEPATFQKAAVKSLLSLPDSSGTATRLLERETWASFTQTVRDTALTSLLSKKEGIESLLTAIENEDVPTWTLSPPQRDRLLKSKDEEIAARAKETFDSTGSGDRQKVYEEHKDVLDLVGESKSGREVFGKVCAQCHRLDGAGFEVGPDLFTVRNKTKDTLLFHILVPDSEMTAGYASFLIETVYGESLTGIIRAETPTSLTLRWSGGEETTLSREDITSMRSTSLSLMPQELEQTITRQEMADLLAYLKGEGVVKGE